MLTSFRYGNSGAVRQGRVGQFGGVDLTHTQCCVLESFVPERLVTLIAANRMATGGEAAAANQCKEVDIWYRGHGAWNYEVIAHIITKAAV